MRLFTISLLEFKIMNYHNIFANKTLPPRKPCSSISTSVERALQIHLFMQNEPKFYNPPTIVSPCLQWIYNNFLPFDLPENEPKRTQNEPKVNIGKIEANLLFAKDLYEFPPFRVIRKRTQSKPNFYILERFAYFSSSDFACPVLNWTTTILSAPISTNFSILPRPKISCLTNCPFSKSGLI